MAYIGPLPAETFTSFATQEFSTSATTSYTLDHPVTNENELALFINNVRQQPGSGKAYTASGTALTLSAATASTDTMYAVFLGRALQTVNPADASVGTSQLAATSVTAAKLNNDIISGTTALAEAPADTDEFLISDAGTLKRIDYSLIKGGGAFEKLITTTASGSSSITFNNTYLTTTYRDYRVVCSHIRPSGNDTVFQMTISSDNGSSFVSSSTYHYADFGIDNENNTLRVHRSNGQDRFYIEFGNNFGTGEGETLNMDMMIYDPLNQSSNNQYFMYHGQLTYVSENTEFVNGVVSGVNKSSATAAYNAIKFQFDSGNIADGTITLYGRKN
jgi:hypothetical protein